MWVLVRVSPIILFQDGFRVKPYPSNQKTSGWKFAPKGKCMGLLIGQKWCIVGNPGNTLSGHHLSVGNPSVCSQGIPCQVLWSGMLGLGRGGQRLAPTWAVHFFHSFANSPGKMGVQNRTLTPDPRTFTKMSPILLQTPLLSWWYPGGAFLNWVSGRESSPAHLDTSYQKLSVQGCLSRFN